MTRDLPLSRYYAQGLGRFNGEDGARDGLNWYEYCRGNPVRYIDPLGLCAEDAWEKLFNFKFELLDSWQDVPNANFNPPTGMGDFLSGIEIAGHLFDPQWIADVGPGFKYINIFNYFARIHANARNNWRNGASWEFIINDIVADTLYALIHAFIDDYLGDAAQE